MIDFPSIKLNIFKKIEYFLILKKLERQFKQNIAQDKNEPGHTYSTWGVEKKILMWTYKNHQHFSTPLFFWDLLDNDQYSSWILEHRKVQSRATDRVAGDRLSGMKLSQREVLLSGIDQVFGNLVERGFAREEKVNKDIGYIITSEGRAFGELLYFLYQNIKSNSSYKDKYSEKSKNQTVDEIGVFFTSEKRILNYYLLWIQEVLLHIFLMYVVLYFTLELIDMLGLLNELKEYFNCKILKQLILGTLLGSSLLFIVSFLFTSFSAKKY